MTREQALALMDTSKTGDLVFFGNQCGLVESGIALSTAFWRRLANHALPRDKRFFISHHVGLVDHDDGYRWLKDSTLSRGGVSRRHLDRVLMQYEPHQVRILPLDLLGERWAIKEALTHFEGTPYEKWDHMPRVAINRNKPGADRVFCSELVVLVFQLAKVEWAMRLEAHNTDPDELFREARRHIELREAA